MTIRDLLSARLITVDPDDSIDRAIALMEAHSIRHLPVVRHDRVVIGMLSDRDLLVAVGWMRASQRRADRPGAASVGPRSVHEIMSIPALALGPDERVERAARIMLEKRFNAAPVTVENRIVGIVTKTDLLRCYLSDRNEPRGAWRFRKVREHMQAKVFWLRPDDLLAQARRLMREKRIRHLPIVADARLVGILSDRDVRRQLGRERVEQVSHPDRSGVADVKIGAIMIRPVETTTGSTTLAEAADRMVTRKFGALPVVEGDALVGILTQTDLLQVFAAACEV